MFSSNGRNIGSAKPASPGPVYRVNENTTTMVGRPTGVQPSVRYAPGLQSGVAASSTPASPFDSNARARGFQGFDDQQAFSNSLTGDDANNFMWWNATNPGGYGGHEAMYDPTSMSPSVQSAMTRWQGGPTEQGPTEQDRLLADARARWASLQQPQSGPRNSVPSSWFGGSQTGGGLPSLGFGQGWDRGRPAIMGGLGSLPDVNAGYQAGPNAGFGGGGRFGRGGLGLLFGRR